MDQKNQFAKITAKLARRAVGALSALCSRSGLTVVLIVAVWNATIVPFVVAYGENSRQPNSSKASNASVPLQTGETVTIFGPQRFERAPGTPTASTAQFVVPLNALAPYVIRVQNGATDGSGRVTNGDVTLNGVILFTQHDFNQQDAEFSRTVSLQPSNTLAVTLYSAIGSHITITVTGTRPLLPPTLQSIEPTRATQGQTLSVTLQGQNTNWLAGQTRASLGAEVSVGGAPQGELGPVTVINSTTAIAQVSISPTAALAPRTARVLTQIPLLPAPANEENVALPYAFTVVASSPPGPASSSVITIAGFAGAPGFADGNTSQARFRDLSGLAVGPDDSIYVADTGNHRIRLVREQPDGMGTPQWVVSTLAGDGTAGFADGPALSARFNGARGVAIEPGGAVIVADTGNHRIRRISTDGSVTTLAGDGTSGFVNGPANQARFNAPHAVAVDHQGNVYVADTGNSAVRVIANGQVNTLAGDGTVGSSDSPVARFDGLAGITTDGAAIFVYLADTGNHRIRRLDQSGSTFTVAGGGRGFADGAADQARFAEPSGIVFDGAGKLVIADTINSLVRSVDPILAAIGAPLAVVTLAGAGERGATDGAGSIARFTKPRGIAVTASSAIIVADTGNHTLRRVLLPPVITSLTPAAGPAGEVVTIDGERFDGRAPERNTVRFTRSAQNGGGQTTAVVTAATRTQLTVVVPEDAATGQVSVQTEGGTAVSANDFEVIQHPPVIADFSPRSGPVGTIVTLTGTRLKVDSGTTRVTFRGDGGTRVPALISSISPNEVRANVPMGAITGAIELTTPDGIAVTNGDFTVELSQDFAITVAPSAIPAVERGSGTAVIHLTSAQSTFTQLARLSAVGLPASVQAAFNAPQITAGATSTLSLLLANSTVTPGNYSFTVRAAADIDGREHVRTATATLNVIAAGQTTLSGRVLSTSDEPVVGATVSLDGRTSTTDAAGAFLLSGVTAGTNRPVMVDGRTASAPNRTYPVILEPATIVAGQANVVPFIFYLPPIDIQYEVELNPGQDTMATNGRVPGLQMTVPANANLRNRDGSPVARISITPLAIDRTPSPLPANVSTALVYTSQPGGAIADIAMPVVYPNLLDADPGARLELYAFNHDTVEWYIYGWGRVSNDGRTISPEIDPATGRPYGLRDFSWHFPNGAGPGGNPNDKDCDNRGGAPVDYSTGIKVETMVDIAFGGARGGLTLSRTYTSDLARRAFVGRFGRGYKDNFDIRLTGSFVAGGAGRYVTAEQLSGRLFSHTTTEADGTLVFSNAITATQQGAIVRKLTSGALEFRDKSGVVMKFDSSGRITSLVDRNGNTTTFTYTGANLTRVTDAVGRSINFTYTGSLVTQVTDPIGRITRYTYDGQSRLLTVTDPAGGVTSYTYDTAGIFATSHLLTITDPRGNRIKEITYNSSGRVIAQLFANGGIERYSYTLTGGLVTSTTITDPLGNTEVKRFNANGYTTGTIDSLGQTSTTERDLTNNLPLSRTGPCGCAETTTTYDANGNVTSSTDRLNQTTRLEYDPVFNNITKITDPLNKVTVMEYDERGNLRSVRNALNQTTTYEYDAFGQLTAVIDPLTHRTRMEYDDFGNLEAIIDPLNNRTKYEYDQVGRLLAVIDPLGRRTSDQYDVLDRLISVTDPSGDPLFFKYDSNSNLTAVTNSLGRKWTYAYDDSDRLILRTDPLGRQTRMQYNVADEVVLVVSPGGKSTLYGYDRRGQMSSVTDPLGNVVTFAYDNRGNLTSLTDQRGNTTTYAFDELFRPTSRRDPLGQVMTLQYNAVGKIREATDRIGRRVVIGYDDIHRPSTVSFADATVTYTYDPAGRATRIVDTQSGSVDWTYDDANRVLSETTAAGQINYTYNGAGDRTSMTAAGDAQVVYGYDTAGRLETLTQGSEIFTYSYDALSRLTGLQRPNGIGTAYAYDAINRLTRLTHTNGLGQSTEDFTYSYNAENQIASITSIGSGQLLPSARTVGQADAGNRISQDGSTSYAFNPEGQTTSKSDTQGATSYQWDARGRLKQVLLPDGQSVSYGYDALGRLATRAAGTSTTSYLYDGLDVVRDTRTDGPNVNYINGLGLDQKLRQEVAGSPVYFLQDHLSSTVALTDANGGVVERTNYEAFGAGNGSALTRYGFTGRDRDAATGLLYFRNRWHDPQQGRFLTEDPIGYEGGLNVYSYVANDPLNLVDPLGLSWETFVDGLITGGITSFVYAALFTAVFTALAAATAGTALAVLPPVLAVLLGAAAAYDLAQQIAALLTEQMCPDEWHYRAGYLIGSTVGAIFGGRAGAARPQPNSFGSNGGNSIRKRDYPSRTRKPVKEKLVENAKDKDGNIRCGTCNKKLDPKDVTIEHNPKLVDTHNTKGYNTDQKTRNDLYNDTATGVSCKTCQSQQGGGTKDTYRPDTGPGYSPRSGGGKPDD